MRACEKGEAAVVQLLARGLEVEEAVRRGPVGLDLARAEVAEEVV